MLQSWAYGVVSGLEIALLAAAFQVAYLPTRVFFVGLAAIYAFAPYVFVALGDAGLAWPLALAAALAVSALAAIIMDVVNHSLLARREASETAHFVSSLGLYVIVTQIVVMVWGNRPRNLELPAAGNAWPVGPVIFTPTEIVSVLACVTLLCGFFAVLGGTALGLRLRAFASNPVQMKLFGHRQRTYRLVAFALSGLLAAAAAMLRAYDAGFDPYNGLSALLIAVVAVIVGGRTSFAGVVVGGLVVGIVRANVAWFSEARWQDAATFAILCAFLLVRPQGLLGRAARPEAA